MSHLPPDVLRASAPLLTGFMVHWCLFSTLSVQTYLYYDAALPDSLQKKCLVYGVYLLESLQTGFVTYDAFTIFASGFGDVQSLTAVHFHWLTIPVMSAIVACISQFFYAYRVFVLSNRQKFAPSIIAIISIGSAVGGILTGYLAYRTGDASQLNTPTTSIAIGFWCGGAALCDILIAAFMTHYLAKHDTGFRHTQRLISKLIRLTVETGTLTAVGALLDLILFFAFPFQEVYMSVALWLPKLYANAMIMVINARLKIGVSGVEDRVHLMSTHSIRFTPSPGTPVDDGRFLQSPSPTREGVTDRKDLSMYDGTLEMKKMGDSEAV
ncbi:hypothetical protein BDZ89DRAFT_1026959 [Hymenopellis radicata]|nr:hypothetical protein BDZ89DRAFT_1026959 [Hymenopellis radicata]